MNDHKRIRTKVLEGILATCGRQLEECEKQLEDIASMMPLAKGPHERTSMNIVLDDQRKVVKSLKRLQSDVSEILGTEP